MHHDYKSIKIEDYTYDLPSAKIALFPLEKRDDSKLLVYSNSKILHHHYKDLPSLLPNETWLVFNETKVIPARLIFKKSSGASIEIFCLEPESSYGDMAMALSCKATVKMKCLVGGASKWKAGTTLEKQVGEDGLLIVSILEKLQDSFLLEFNWTPTALSFSEVLQKTGDIPLPPYIKRKTDSTDVNRYQTVYANKKGSVAAPTAGLHFTKQLLDSIAEKNIRKGFVTLHVGAGTFRPVKSVTMGEHLMHEEWIDVGADFIEELLINLNNNKKVIAVGTTSVRTLESLYWLGVKAISNRNVNEGISQWEVYEDKQKYPSPIEAIKALQSLLVKQNQSGIITKTALLILPGYDFKIVKGIITNFHQPQSTLLLLVAAFIGKDWREIYKSALENNYRFLSYGDGSLLLRS
jgi:S-adenosylmethionine:tRNA ribosyltransferase-isomerase